ncbi:MAG: hypothetical protein ABSG65_26105 [Bryobacteraceae bacterium]|jgi:hypothetical protein
MHGRITFWRDSAQLPLVEIARPERPLDVVVPYTDPALTARALAAATELARGFEAAVTLMAVYVVPFRAPLECQDGIRKRLEADLTAVARTIPVSVSVKLVFARSREEAYLRMLGRQSLVVIGARNRPWPTPETRLARRLTAGGHSVAVVKVR